MKERKKTEDIVKQKLSYSEKEMRYYGLVPD